MELLKWDPNNPWPEVGSDLMQSSSPFSTVLLIDGVHNFVLLPELIYF